MGIKRIYQTLAIAFCLALLLFAASRSGHAGLRKDGRATGFYQDFMTGFVTEKGDVWGRPVGVAVVPDGSLMVTDDGSNSIWRVTYAKK